jgi:hypothetical protein
MDITGIAVGAAALGISRFGYLQLKKWIPAGWAALKAKLSSGKIDLSSIEASLSGKVTALETGLVAQIKADVDKLKTVAPPNLFPPSPAPQSQQPQPQG